MVLTMETLIMKFIWPETHIVEYGSTLDLPWTHPVWLWIRLLSYRMFWRHILFDTLGVELCHCSQQTHSINSTQLKPNR